MASTKVRWINIKKIEFSRFLHNLMSLDRSQIIQGLENPLTYKEVLEGHQRSEICIQVRFQYVLSHR
jgi:hypothetical protein